MDEFDQSGPRSRRALLAGVLGGVGAWALAAVDRVAPAQAAAGDPLRLGRTNRAGGQETVVHASTDGAVLNATQGGDGVAVRGESAGGHGAILATSRPGKVGLLARNTAGSAGSGAAIRAEGGRNPGIRARTDAPLGAAVDARNASGDSDSSAVYGQSVGGAGLFGAATASSGPTWGVYAYALSGSGTGVAGFANANAGATLGVAGHTVSDDGIGVSGENSGGGIGVVGKAPNGVGVYGTSTAANTIGVHGYSAGGVGVLGQTSTGDAAQFHGKVKVIGELSKSSGAFRIDHPLDPARRYLQHSFVESPDMKNIYDGLVTADARGRATVELPDWFEALNRDARYALTAIGAPMPELHVRRGIEGNAFEIAGAAPGGEVSWQVTGIRRDAWAEAHRIAVELDKTGAERGRYLHPAEHGRPAAEGIDPGA